MRGDERIHALAVLAAQPDNVEAQANLGIVLYFQGECPQAIGHLDRALKLQPKLAKIQALLGVCQEREGQSDEAKRNLEASLPSVKETTIRILIEKKLVEVYYAEGNLQLASRMTDDLIGMDPHDPDVLYMVYRIHMDIAERARDTLAATAPGSPRMHQIMAEHFVNEGDAGNAINQFELALGSDPELPGVHYELAEAILEDSKSAAALAKATGLLKESLVEYPRNAGAEAKLGQIAMYENNRNLARKYFSQALAFRADEPDALEGMADIASYDGDNEKAVKYLLRASQEDPMNEKVYYRLSRLYRQLNQKQNSDRELALFIKIRDLKKKTEVVEMHKSSP
jgi:tetratricopeptide (TPR) repeat protein